MPGALYQLTFPNGKSYIGITAGKPALRFRRHLATAKWEKQRGNRAVCAAIRKHGMPVPHILAIADDWNYLTDIEKKAIIAFGTKAPGGYNLTDGGDGAHGVTRSEKERAVIGRLSKERFTSSEFRERHKAATATGTKAAAEKISSASQRMWADPAIRGRLIEARRRNRPSAETRAKMAAAQKARRAREVDGSSCRV
jgi:hypothetical protein